LDSHPESPLAPPPEAPREPILTLPPALTAYILLIAVIHLRVLLPPEMENWTIDVFGFIPKRYDSTLLDITFPGGDGAKVWTFVTYSLLHANLTHIAFNVLWLLPFGSALARRFGAVRFFVFMAVTAAAGALAHLLTHEHAIAPMIGASASVSGTMAAAIRFAFVKGSFLSFNRGDAEAAAKVPALSLWRALRNGRVLAFLAIWFGVNILFGATSLSAASSPGCCCSRCSIRSRARGTMLQMRRRWISRGASDRRLRLGSNSSIIFATQKQSGPTDRALLLTAPRNRNRRGTVD
jgi:membrane associated rhomboid family serine protease